MSNKLLNESILTLENAFIPIFDEDFVLNNGKLIAEKYDNKEIVIITKQLNLYGLLIKNVGVLNNDVELKCLIYNYPQNGILKGQTFWTTREHFSAPYVVKFLNKKQK